MKPLSITAKRMLRRAVAAFCACACVFAVSACGADETGKIRIGIKFDQPGLGFKKNGTYVGFDVDVAKYVAKKLGYSEDEIVWKESPSKQREAMSTTSSHPIPSPTNARRSSISPARISWPDRICWYARTKPALTDLRI